jgi:hypothetical protein
MDLESGYSDSDYSDSDYSDDDCECSDYSRELTIDIKELKRLLADLKNQILKDDDSSESEKRAIYENRKSHWLYDRQKTQNSCLFFDKEIESSWL